MRVILYHPRLLPALSDQLRKQGIKTEMLDPSRMRAEGTGIISIVIDFEKEHSTKERKSIVTIEADPKPEEF